MRNRYFIILMIFILGCSAVNTDIKQTTPEDTPIKAKGVGPAQDISNFVMR